MKKIILLILTFLSCILLPNQSFSQNGGDNGNGVEKSSLNHMFQGSFSYTQMSGNVDGHNIGSNLNAALWGKGFSNILFAKSNIQSVESGGNEVTYTMYDILYLLRVDIAGDLFAVGAFDYEKNEPILIDRVVSGFLGAGYDIMAKPGHNLSVIAAVGRTSEKNTVPVDNPYGDFTSIFLMNSYDVQITEDFSITQKFDFFAPIDDIERRKVTLSLSANTKLFKIFGVSYQFSLNYHNDPLVSLTTMQQNEKMDLTQTIALTFQL